MLDTFKCPPRMAPGALQCSAVLGCSATGQNHPRCLCFQLLISTTLLFFLLALAPHVHSWPPLWVSRSCAAVPVLISPTAWVGV